MNKKKLLKAAERAVPTVLSCLAVVGTAATAVMAAKATPKAVKLLQEAEEERGRPLTKREIVKAAAPAYIPAILTGAATVACIVGANILNKHQQASITSAYVALDQAYKRYRKAANEVYGEDADTKIHAQMADKPYISANGCSIYDPETDPGAETRMFYDSYSQRYFESTIPAVLNALYHLNRNLALRGDVTVNELYQFLGIEKIENGDDIGWTFDDLMEDGMIWLDFENKFTKLEDGMECCIITACIEPLVISEYLPF